ncbi:MAG: hypothetical protein ACXV5Q_13705 [Frankiaceae bacterium]
MWTRLSRETLYQRFHASVGGYPQSSVHQLAETDHRDLDAIVALVDDEAPPPRELGHTLPVPPVGPDVAPLTVQALRARGMPGGYRLILFPAAGPS